MESGWNLWKDSVLSPLTFSSHTTLCLKRVSSMNNPENLPASNKKRLQWASCWGGGGIDEKEVLSKMYSMRQSLKKKKTLWNPAEHEQPERTTVYVPRRSISPKHECFQLRHCMAFPSHCAPVYKTAVFNGELNPTSFWSIWSHTSTFVHVADTFI